MQLAEVENPATLERKTSNAGNTAAPQEEQRCRVAALYTAGNARKLQPRWKDEPVIPEIGQRRKCRRKTAAPIVSVLAETAALYVAGNARKYSYAGKRNRQRRKQGEDPIPRRGEAPW